MIHINRSVVLTAPAAVFPKEKPETLHRMSALGQRNMLDVTKTSTETTIAAANASPIILPSCSGHPVFGSKYTIICSPAHSGGRLR